MSKLKVIVLFDRWDPPGEGSAASEDAPFVRDLDDKEVEHEVADELVTLGHDTILHMLDGSAGSLNALQTIECDLVFNLAESFAGNDTADVAIAGYLDLIGKNYTGAGVHGLLYAQDKGVAKKIFSFHGIQTPVFARVDRGRLDFSHDLEFPVIVKPSREDGSIGIEFDAVVSSLKDLLERIDWLHAHFDGPLLIEEYIDGREIYIGVLGNGNATPLPVIELDLSKLPEGKPRIACAEVKWAKGSQEYECADTLFPTDLSDETTAELQRVAVAAYGALELRDYGRVDLRLRPDGRVSVIEVNPNPWLASHAELASAAKQAGRSYGELIGEIVDLAMARSH